MMSPGFMEAKDPPNAVEAARHLCQEARVVLTSLRGGPPVVARGELATDLMDLRSIVKAVLSECVSNSNSNSGYPAREHLQSVDESIPFRHPASPVPVRPQVQVVPAAAATPPPSAMIPDGSEQIMDDGLGEGTVFVEEPQPSPSYPDPGVASQRGSFVEPQTWALDVGPFARPFLAVIVDPRAAGPHTLVALRCLFRLVEQGSLLQPTAVSNNTTTTPSNPHHPFTVLFESLTQGVLSCKFEQTDAGADEAVEMAIADLLALLVRHNLQSMKPSTLMDAFNTVFVTRNTFVHSPAMCYHFEDVLTAIVSTVFGDFNSAATSILEFLVNQLLHTPLVGGDVVDESMREAQMAHAATRLLCLRLVNCALKTGWDVEQPLDLLTGEEKVSELSTEGGTTNTNKIQMTAEESEELLRIIKDDLCLSLLMTGQAIWTYHDASSSISPGLISLDVLSEICNTLSTLWHTIPLRKHLVAQFETIFTGFYQRALALLRKRSHPVDSITFNADLVFDAEVEVILESLVDLLCLHDFRHSIADGDGGSLETLFATYDCHMGRSDVAAGLMVELCRCCGGSVNEEGNAIMTRSNSLAPTPNPGTGASTPMDAGSGDLANGEFQTDLWRPVPPHLKELCAQALMGAMKCLFRDDKASKETLLKRSQRELTIMLSGEELQHDGSGENKTEESSPSKQEDNDHFLRNIKSKKRLMRKGAMLFNEKASTGIKFLVSAGLVSDPPTPTEVAKFLRNGLVFGLKKHPVGAYLGEHGKRKEPGKSPPNWERDSFHKEVLEIYCKLFKFEGQSLLDGLRMFLSSFRLPGEAQQIDRILQAFSDSCGAVCEESMAGRLKLFSEDPKRASDGAYLLSFSVIMLNTDLHNPNIREDRKMKLEDFIRNNTNYGSDITDKGKEFPREFLEGIYESIKEEEIRTEGEGADGCMTIERWKDVLRGSTEVVSDDSMPSKHDAEDLTELVLEHVWIPIMSAIGAFWNIASEDAMFDPNAVVTHGNDGPQKGNMLGVQGARLGMDMAVEMLEGVLQLRRLDIFRRIFGCVCKYTGLIGEHSATEDERANHFVNSLEAQSGLIVATRVARTACDDIGVDGWKLVWQMLFELRDIKMLGADCGGDDFASQNVLKESEPDLLTSDARAFFNMWLTKGDVGARKPQRESSGVSSVLGAFGRALFGSDDDGYDAEEGGEGVVPYGDFTPRGKQALVIWDEHISSQEEGDSNGAGAGAEDSQQHVQRSIGAQFEHDLILENVMLSQQAAMPVTGLESLEETRNSYLSPLSRGRKRVAKSCDFHGLVSDSRFMTVDGIRSMLQALLEVIDSQSQVDSEAGSSEEKAASTTALAEDMLDLHLPIPPTGVFPLSPASLTFAEVLLCEISLKNKDRLSCLWPSLLETHYKKRLGGISNGLKDRSEARGLVISSALEKCVTGLLRLSACVTNKDVADSIIGSWIQLLSLNNDLPEVSLIATLDKQISGGLWRIVNNVDGNSKLGTAGWDGLFALASWCAARGGQLPPLRANGLMGNATLAEDDPALQCYRSLHLMLNTDEVRSTIPYGIVTTLRAVTFAGERRNCSQLTMAGLDLMVHFLQKRGIQEVGNDEFWSSCWRVSVETIAYISETGAGSNVRQHGLSMLVNCCTDKLGSSAAVKQLCAVMVEVCIPVAGRRIAALRSGEAHVEGADELMIEFEMSIKLIFKPLRHNIMRVVQDGGDVVSLWKAVLAVLEELLRDEKARAPPTSPNANGNNPMSNALAKSMNELANEHLQNAIMFLIGEGLITGSDPKSPGDFTAVTWESVERMGFCKGFVSGWKEAAANPPVQAST